MEQALIKQIFIFGTAIMIFVFSLFFFLVLRSFKSRRRLKATHLYQVNLLTSTIKRLFNRINKGDAQRKEFVNEYLNGLMTITKLLDLEKVSEMSIYEDWLAAMSSIYERLNQENREITEAMWAEIQNPETPLEIIVKGYYELYRRRNLCNVNLLIDAPISGVSSEVIRPILSLIQDLGEQTPNVSIGIISNDGQVLITSPKPVSIATREKLDELVLVYGFEMLDTKDALQLLMPVLSKV